MRILSKYRKQIIKNWIKYLFNKLIGNITMVYYEYRHERLYFYQLYFTCDKCKCEKIRSDYSFCPDCKRYTKWKEVTTYSRYNNEPIEIDEPTKPLKQNENE